jgi:hypothetical protein
MNAAESNSDPKVYTSDELLIECHTVFDMLMEYQDQAMNEELLPARLMQQIEDMSNRIEMHFK